MAPEVAAIALVVLVVVCALVVAAAVLWRRRRKPRTGGDGGAAGRRCLTYTLPRKAGGLIYAVNLSDGRRESTVVTVYYPRGSIRFTKKNALPPGCALVHTEHEDHDAGLHQVDRPFSWHAHIRTKAGRMPGLVADLLRRYGPADHRTHAVRIARLWGRPRAKVFGDGARASAVCNHDDSGLGLLADVDTAGATAAGPAAVEAALAASAHRMRPTSAAAIVDILLGDLGRDAVVAWSDERGGFAHRAAEVGDAETVGRLVATPAEANVARSRDLNTPAHLAAYRLARAGTAAERRRAQAVFDRLVAAGADLGATNRYGETANDLLGRGRA